MSINTHEHIETVLQAIDNDDYNTLRVLAAHEEDEEEAYRLRQYANQAYHRAWGYDEAKDRSL